MPSAGDLENGVLEYWRSGVMESGKEKMAYGKIGGLMCNTPVLLYSIAPI